MRQKKTRSNYEKKNTSGARPFLKTWLETVKKLLATDKLITSQKIRQKCMLHGRLKNVTARLRQENLHSFPNKKGSNRKGTSHRRISYSMSQEAVLEIRRHPRDQGLIRRLESAPSNQPVSEDVIDPSSKASWGLQVLTTELPKLTELSVKETSQILITITCEMINGTGLAAKKNSFTLKE